jgi:hypothetical protein
MSITSYQILTARTPAALVTLVTAAIAGGKVPVGPLTFGTAPNGEGVLYQAVAADSGATCSAYAIAEGHNDVELNADVTAKIAGSLLPAGVPVQGMQPNGAPRLYQVCLTGSAAGAGGGGGGGGTTVSAAVLSDTKAANTNGGSLTDSAWNTRVLNTEDADPSSIVTLASNQFTLGAGTYLIEWSVPGFNIGNHLSRLYDVTGAAAVKNGSSETSSASSQSRSMGSAIVTPTGSNVYRIEHQGGSGGAASTAAGQGPSGSTGASVFTVVRILKLA